MATELEFTFSRQELEKLYGDQSQPGGTINCSGFVVYGGVPVDVDLIRFFDSLWGSARS